MKYYYQPLYIASFYEDPVWDYFWTPFDQDQGHCYKDRKMVSWQ
jgi:hypothetical protein